MIFVDTSAWFAAFVPNDRYHSDAEAWLDQNADQLLTTDYILDELVTLLKCRGEFRRAVLLGEEILRERIARLEWVTPADLEAPWDVFCQFDDKQWSFTDCTSRVVIDRLSLPTAFAFDEHFRQFGNVNVVPA